MNIARLEAIGFEIGYHKIEDLFILYYTIHDTCMTIKVPPEDFDSYFIVDAILAQLLEDLNK